MSTSGGLCSAYLVENLNSTPPWRPQGDFLPSLQASCCLQAVAASWRAVLKQVTGQLVTFLNLNLLVL